jgi:hypothetical protein
MTQLRGWLVGFAVFVAGACGSSSPPAAHGGEVISAAGSGADPTSVENSLAAASGVVAGVAGADVPACKRDGALSPDAAAAACRSSRTYLRCDLGLGAAELCGSDDPHACPDGSPADHCQMLCEPNEYFVACGSVGPAIPPAPEPAAGCRSLPAGPGGGVPYCCPCLK